MKSKSKVLTVSLALSFASIQAIAATTAPATVATPAPATILTCQQMSNTYGISDNITWGTAPAAIQAQWMNKGCHTFAQANPATAVAAPASVATPAPATILTCQQMSDTYGITHNKTWGTATAAIQDQWMKKGCTTIAQAKPAIAQTSVPKPNSQSEVAPMQTMSQEAAPMSRSAKPVTPSTVPPKPNSPPKVAPMQVMSQEAAPMSRSATQPVAPAAVPPKKK